MDQETKKIVEDNKEKLDRIDERVEKIHKKNSKSEVFT